MVTPRAAAELERIARAADFAATQFRDWSFFIGPSATHFFKVAEEKTIAKLNGVKWTQSDVVAQAAKKAVDLAHAAIKVRQVLFFARLRIQCTTPSSQWAAAETTLCRDPGLRARAARAREHGAGGRRGQ